MTHHLPSTIVRKYIETFGIPLKPGQENAVITVLAHHLEAVVYNVTGIALAIALVNQRATIDASHLKLVRNYIESSCDNKKKKGGLKGGASMPSEYFGYKHPNFSEWNHGETNVSQIRFDEGIARPEISGGAVPMSFMTKDKHVKAVIKTFLKHHEMKIQKGAMQELLAILDVHANCMAEDLHALSPLSKKQLDKVMKYKRHAVFH
jgi:histone H3/H4